MSAYDDQDKVLSERLRELVRLAGAGELADVECEPGGPFEQGMRLTGRSLRTRRDDHFEDGRSGTNGRDAGASGTAGGESGRGGDESRAGTQQGEGGAPEGGRLAPVASYGQDGHEPGPDGPDLPDGPHAPETPNAPDAPDVPESPDLPEHGAPEAPDLPRLPGVPDAPDVHGPAETPEIPGAPDILESPEIPPTPDIPPPPAFPDMPEIPDAPEIPESPGIYDQPEIPDPPRIDDPELPETDRPAELPGTVDDPASPVAPDTPRPPDLPDPPRPAPEAPDAVRDAVTAMHSSRHDAAQLTLIRGRFGHAERPGRAEGDERTPPGGQREHSLAEHSAEESAALPAATGGGHGGRAGAGGHVGTGGGSNGAGGSGSGGAGTPGDGEGDSELEAALRRMLRQSVDHIEPAPESLTYLQHAVPARRAHRRRVLAGAAAAVVLAGVGVPSLIGTGLVPGLGGESSFDAGGSREHSQDVGGQGGAGQSQGPGDLAGGTGADGGKPGGGQGSKSPSPSEGGDTSGTDENDSIATSAPSCGRQQLGRGSVSEEPAAPDGKVYGSFRVVNTSSEACTVEGEGVVGASARGRANVERINVVDHTPGDPAVGLPDPDLAASELVLKPGDAYEVKWAWVPDKCGPPGKDKPKPKDEPKAAEGNGPEGSQGGNNGDSGGPDGPGGPGGGPGGDDGGNGTDQGGGSSGGTTDGKSSVVVSHTPEVGDPAAADTELEGACAGTLYRTGVLAAN